MEEAEIRVMTRISTSEFERRWEAVRQAMKESGLDFLLIQNSHTYFDGNIQWFTGERVLSGYPATVIFPRGDEMTTIWHGPWSSAEPEPPDESLHGVKKQISVPILLSLSNTTVFDAEKVVEELASYKNCRIGLVGMGFIPTTFYQYVTGHLETAKFEDATDLVDNIKAIKSDEELSFIRQTCQLQDALFEYTLTLVKPGAYNYAIERDIIHKTMELGGDATNLIIISAPAGTAPGGMPGDRLINEGDYFVILLETNGPGGFWGELVRTICLGKISPELQRQFELAQQAQKVTLDLLKPGADPTALWDANNAFLRNNGYPEERRIYAHGQGYDMVERPSLDLYETMKVQARMVIAVHPVVKSTKAIGWVCEDYLVHETGEAECLHKTSQKIFLL